MSSKTKALTGEMLKAMLPDAMIYRGTAGCIEDCVSWGIYRLVSSSTTALTPPMGNWNYGILEVFIRDVDVIQRLTHIDGYGVFQRIKRNGVWKDWYRIEMTKVQ